jgi:hypothetical protein
MPVNVDAVERQGVARHGLAAAALVAAAVLAVVLAVQVSLWFFIAAPFLLTAAYAAWLGMSASRTLDALERGEGGGPILPF